MICEKCESDPCTCQKALAIGQPHRWFIQHCTRPGCDSAIRSHDGLPESELICKWCRAREEQGCPFAVYPDHAAHSSAQEGVPCP